MGYVVHILVALLSLAGPELGWTGSESLLPLAVLVLAVPHALGYVARRLLLAGRFRTGIVADRLLSAAAPLLQILLVFGMGWTTALERWCGRGMSLAGWPGMELLLALAPFFFLELLAIDARVRFLETAAGARPAGRAFQVRLFLSALMPFVLYLGVSSLIALSAPLRIHIEEVALFGAGFSVLLLVGFVAFLPFLLRSTWDTAPLEAGPERGVLEDLARRAGFRCREILVWRTGHQMANAAIVGFTPGSRVVLFSDALLGHLGPRELTAVFAHEIGHAKRHHAVTFASFALGAFLGVDLCLTALDIEDPAVGIGLFAAAIGLWYLVFGMLSRRFELEADLMSMELLGEAAPLMSALEKVTGAHAHERSSWRHFSTAQRAAFLESAEHDPAVGRRLQRRLRLWSAVGIGFFLVMLGLQLFQLLGSFEEDRMQAALRLGRYEEAAERLAASDGVDEELTALIELGAALSTEERAIEELERLALEAVRARDLDRAYLLVLLAALRGREDLIPVLEAIEAWEEVGERVLEVEDPEWSEALGDLGGS